MLSRPVRPRRIVSTLLLAATLLSFVVVVYRLPEVEDFIAFWSASRIALSHGDPYDPTVLHHVQLATGLGYDEPMLYFNPPWTTTVFMPLGLLPLQVARAIWAVASLVMLWVSGYWLHTLFWPRASNVARPFAILIPGLFVHGWAALKIGQISPLVVFSLVGAMVFYRQRPLVSGGFLVIAAVKPQICFGALLLFGVRVLVDRSWRVVGGALGTLGALLLPLTLLRPTWSLDFGEVVASPPLFWQTPTLATILRGLFPASPTDEFMMLIAALLLVAVTRWTLRTGNWNDGIAMAILVTMVFTIYAWDFDHVMLLIPIFHLFGRVRDRRRVTWIVAALLVTINLITLMMRVPTAPDAFFFFWVVPAFSIIYVVALLWSRNTQPVARLRVEPDPVR